MLSITGLSNYCINRIVVRKIPRQGKRCLSISHQIIKKDENYSFAKDVIAGGSDGWSKFFIKDKSTSIEGKLFLY